LALIGIIIGLGYYSRAKRLLDASRVVVNQYNGKLPDKIDVLEREIAGIGRYTAGIVILLVPISHYNSTLNCCVKYLYLLVCGF
jgi:adenine-specific DNA glycosylase